MSLAHYIARHLPSCVLQWAVIVVWAYATTGEYSSMLSTGLTVEEVLKRWQKGK